MPVGLGGSGSKSGVYDIFYSSFNDFEDDFESFSLTYSEVKKRMRHCCALFVLKRRDFN